MDGDSRSDWITQDIDRIVQHIFLFEPWNKNWTKPDKFKGIHY